MSRGGRNGVKHLREPGRLLNPATRRIPRAISSNRPDCGIRWNEAENTVTQRGEASEVEGRPPEKVFSKVVSQSAVMGFRAKTGEPASQEETDFISTAGLRGVWVFDNEIFRHAQKTEAIGRLTAGVAHDFYNILTVIQGYALLLMKGERSQTEINYHLNQISSAANRGAILTRQLLAFSRREAVQFEPLDLNALIENPSTCRSGCSARISPLGPACPSLPDPGGYRDDRAGPDESAWTRDAIAMVGRSPSAPTRPRSGKITSKLPTGATRGVRLRQRLYRLRHVI
jgi:hypothetical protein